MPQDSLFEGEGPAPVGCLKVFNKTCRRRQWHPTPVLLSGKSHGRRSLVGYSPWGCEESDTTERLHFHFSLSCIGEGNGNPLQCSCLENPRDGGAWWAAVYGVAQSWTRLKRLGSSGGSNKTRGGFPAVSQGQPADCTWPWGWRPSTCAGRPFQPREGEGCSTRSGGSRH